MADTLNFGEAVQRAGVSRHRLNQAITSGRLPAVRGGGPGKPTTIQLTDLQAWCTSEGLAMPVETSERLERSTGVDLVALMRWMDQMSTAIARVEVTLERLDRSQAPAIDASDQKSVPHVEGQTTASAAPSKAELLTWLHTLRGSGLSLQKIAEELNARGIPTLSGRGR